MTVKWYGDDFLEQLRADTPDALFEAADTFVEQAKSRAPRDSGDLADSGYAATKEKSTYQAKKFHTKPATAKEGEAVAGFAAFYVRFVEFGTKHQAARPFMRPTLDEAKAQLGNVITARLKKKIAK